ncbi:MAG: hypothetical protein LQ337_002482 [Flavoplaca oasis]|nr:MAG: hypothetical protein LQ337_002482 [Flavoplaca oasis]
MSGAGDWMPAIQQTYTYCVNANVQYGYLITDKELLAVRVSWLASPGQTVPKSSINDEPDHRLPPNENMTLKKTGAKRNQRAQTPTGSETQDSFDLKHPQSFRSDASDVRHILSDATLNQGDRQASPAVAASPRKRTREEPREGGDPGRTRRRVVAPRTSKH